MRIIVFFLLFFISISNNIFSWNTLSETEYLDLDIEDKIDYLFLNYPISENPYISSNLMYPVYAEMIVVTDGETCIPFLHHLIRNTSLKEMRIDPNKCNIDKIGYVLSALYAYDLIDQEQINWFANQFQKMIRNYLEEFMCIDAVLLTGEFRLEDFTGNYMAVGEFKTWGEYLEQKYKSFGYNNLQVYESSEGVLLNPYEINFLPKE